MTDHEMNKIWCEAIAAGVKAGDEVNPTPMVVERHANPLNDNSEVVESWHVPDGLCGFGWVVIKPATSRFVRWLKKNDIGDRHWKGGWCYWIHNHNQSYERKRANARAMAEVLNSYGIKTTAGSALD